MATTDNIVNILPGTLLQDDEYDLPVTFHEEEELCGVSFSFRSYFSLRLDDEDNQCNVSVVTDDTFFLDDDLSTASSIDDSGRIEEVSTHAPKSKQTWLDTKTQEVVVPLETVITQREEREWKPLLARHATLRERRRGGKRPTTCATSTVRVPNMVLRLRSFSVRMRNDFPM